MYTLKLHPTLDVLVTGGRDGVARVWDMRTRSNVHVLSGHTGTVADLVCQEADPQVITGSLDSTVRMWDLAAGKTMGVLTHHKKGVRALATHPTEFTFATGSTGSIKQWKCPEGAFMQNFEGHNAIINTLAVNDQNVFFSGGDNGSMSFWDWKSGYRFQALDTTAQPGSLDAESGIMSSIFDVSGSRLICGEADKTSKYLSLFLLVCRLRMLTVYSQNLEGRYKRHARITSDRLEANAGEEEILKEWDVRWWSVRWAMTVHIICIGHQEENNVQIFAPVYQLSLPWLHVYYYAWGIYPILTLQNYSQRLNLRIIPKSQPHLLVPHRQPHFARPLRLVRLQVDDPRPRQIHSSYAQPSGTHEL